MHSTSLVALAASAIAALATAQPLAEGSRQEGDEPVVLRHPVESPDFRQKLDERVRAIRTELQALPQRLADDPALREQAPWAEQWAGEYRCGDGLGMNVTISIAPNGGVAYTWYGCMGLYGANYGSIAESHEDGLTLELAVPAEGPLMDYLSSRIYFVRWGDRRYLVPESQMLDFCNELNRMRRGQGELLDRLDLTFFSAPLHSEDGAKPAEGSPHLPARYRSLLRPRPVAARITAIRQRDAGRVTDGVDFAEAVATLDAGIADGLFVGMKLYLPESAVGADWTLTIISADDASATAELQTFHSAGKFVSLPEVGQEVSSRR